MKKELWRLIYLEDGVHLAVARLIGYAGASPFVFWDAAKLLPSYDQRMFMDAMLDLTNHYRREGSNPRYEFSAEARKAVRVLLGPPPEDPEFSVYWSRQIFQSGMTEPWIPPVQQPQTADEPKMEEPTPKKKRVRKKAG